MKIEFELNGLPVCMDAPGNRRVVDLLREDLGLTGTKEGCGTGECGACTVLVDGRSRLSCLMLASQLAGRKIVTIEGLAPQGSLHPVQAAFVENGAVQCGFCTPGMVLTTVDLLERHPHPRRQEAAEAISGNLCRCTGYKKILDAIETVDPHTPLKIHSPEKAAGASPVAATGSTAGKACPVFLPQSIDELWRMLSEHPGARVFSGGTDLLVWIRSRRIDPPALIGLERIRALRGVTETADGVRIGAGTSHEKLLEDPLVGKWFPVLIQALKILGSPHIRHVGTLGGNIMTASPAGDTLPPLYALGAGVELRSAQGTRLLPVDAFILGPGRTALAPGEILSAILIATPEKTALQHFEKVGLRNAMACAVASLAALIRVSASGVIETACLAWGSVGPTVMRSHRIEAALVGHPFNRETLESVIPLVREQIAPIDDVRASAAYRRLVAGNLLLRLLAPDTASSGPSLAGSSRRTKRE